VVEEPVRAPGQAEVAVEVRAIGTNPVDYKVYSGEFGTDPARLPIAIGTEAAGVVTAVGEQAEGPGRPVRVGDEVVLYPIEGAYASDIVVPASTIKPKPSTFTFEEASGLMVTGSVAVHALTVAAVGRGDTLIVHGASGGVGHMAVQIAVNARVRVIGTSSEGGHAYLRQLGAEPVVYGDGLIDRVRALAPDGVDAAIDTVGTDEAIDTSVALVADRDRVVTIAGFRRGFELGLKVLGAAPGADPGTEIRAAAGTELVRQAEAGTLKVRVARTYPLVEAAAAHRELAGGHSHGKIVLIP
jgi:NADPH:quinone reductase